MGEHLEIYNKLSKWNKVEGIKNDILDLLNHPYDKILVNYNIQRFLPQDVEIFKECYMTGFPYIYKSILQCRQKKIDRQTLLITILPMYIKFFIMDNKVQELLKHRNITLDIDDIIINCITNLLNNIKDIVEYCDNYIKIEIFTAVIEQILKSFNIEDDKDDIIEKVESKYTSEIINSDISHIINDYDQQIKQEMFEYMINKIIKQYDVDIEEQDIEELITKCTKYSKITQCYTQVYNEIFQTILATYEHTYSKQLSTTQLNNIRSVCIDKYNETHSLSKSIPLCKQLYFYNILINSTKQLLENNKQYINEDVLRECQNKYQSNQNIQEYIQSCNMTIYSNIIQKIISNFTEKYMSKLSEDDINQIVDACDQCDITSIKSIKCCQQNIEDVIKNVFQRYIDKILDNYKIKLSSDNFLKLVNECITDPSICDYKIFNEIINTMITSYQQLLNVHLSDEAINILIKNSLKNSFKNSLKNSLKNFQHMTDFHKKITDSKGLILARILLEKFPEDTPNRDYIIESCFDDFDTLSPEEASEKCNKKLIPRSSGGYYYYY